MSDSEYIKVQKRIANVKDKIEADYLYPCYECQGAGKHLRFIKKIYDEPELLNRGRMCAGSGMAWAYSPEIIIIPEEGKLNPWDSEDLNISFEKPIKISLNGLIGIVNMAKKFKKEKAWKGYEAHRDWIPKYKDFLKKLNEVEKKMKVSK